MKKEKPKRLAPTTDTLRVLFAKSGNQCAFPGCEHLLIDEDENFIAQVCHIEDALPGCRFNEDMTNEERRSSSNLILFCYQHHIKTNDELKFSVKRLKEIKELHENKSKDIFKVKDLILQNIFTDILNNIKNDTTEILKNQSKHDQKFEEIINLLSKNQEQTETVKSHYIDEIETILTLRDSNNHLSALELLKKMETDKWNKLGDIEKYKLLANIGIAYSDLNNQNEAAKYFIKCLKYNSENEKALGFAALGYVILNKSKKAKEIIKKAFEKNNKNLNACAAYIVLNKDKMSFTEIAKKIPSEVHNSSEISHLFGVLARDKKDFKTSINWFQKALDAATRNRADFRAILATTILESITDPFQIISDQLDNETRNKIAYVIDLFNDAWSEVKDTDLRISRVWFLINRSVAKRFIKDYKGALNDIKLAESLEEDDILTLRHLAILLFETDNVDSAIETLDKLKLIESNDKSDIDLFKAEALYKKKEFNRCIDILLDVLKTAANIKITEQAQSTLIYSYMQLGNFTDAKKLSLSIIENNPDYLRGYIDTSKVLLRLNEVTEATVLLNKAFEKLNDNSDYADIQELANKFYDIEDFQKASLLFERITNPKIYSDLSINLLKTYFKSGEREKALKLCKSLRSVCGPIDIITEIQSNIYESVDDLSNAINVCEEYLKIYPDDQKIQIRLAIIYARIKDGENIKRILAKIEVLGDNLPVDIIYNLAYLNISIGEIKKGLEIAYQARRKYIDNGEVHLKYFHVISSFRSPIEYLSPSQEVEINTVVRIKDNTGNFQTYYISDKTENLSNEELSIISLLGKSLIGKKTGDIITLDKDIGDAKSFEITGIFNKYIHAFQESIHLLETKFIDTDGFSSFSIKDNADVKENLRPIFDLLDETENTDKEIQKFYQNRQLTIGSLSEIRKQNSIKTWSIAIGSMDFGMYSQNSIHNENQIAFFHLNNKKGIVIDLISILTLASIKKLEILESLSNKMNISRSTVETIDELIREFKGMDSNGYITVGKVNGQYVKDHVTKERIDNNIKHYENLLIWIEMNCAILPCNIALSINTEKKEELDKTLGRPFVDNILIAKEHDCLLLSDEGNLRELALNEFNVNGFSNYDLLNYCLQENHINKKSFDDTVTSLITMNYKHLPVNANILFNCAYISGFRFEFPFNTTINALNYYSSEKSSIIVAVEFFYNLYTHNVVLLPQIHISLIVPILHTLTKNRNFEIVINKTLMFIENKFMLLPIQKDELLSIIKDFIKANKY